jgi:hypothetical protein
MSEAVTTYHILCHAPDPQAALATMSRRKLGEILAYLESMPPSGIPKLILDVATSEAAARWRADNQDKSGAVGEGNA